MSKISGALQSLQRIDELAGGDGFLCRIHPLAKLILTVLFLVLVVSFSPKELFGLLGMGIYLFILYQIGDISFTGAIRRMRVVLPFILIIGIFNPFFDREVVFMLGKFPVTSGIISMITLVLKGLFTVFASYALIVSTPIDGICHAMRILHIPKIIVTEFMLVYRYVALLLRESEKVMQSYFLRAPGQKGINIKAWGPLVGLMLLRSLDRADTIYKSMCLRGFQSEFFYSKAGGTYKRDWIFFFVMAGIAVILRVFPVLEIIGNLVTFHAKA